MTQSLVILAAAGFTVLVALSLGRLLLRHVPAPFYRGEEWIYAFLAGSACLSSLVFVICSLQILSRGLLAALGVVVVGAALWARVWRTLAEPAPPLPRAWKCGFLAIFAVFTVLYFFNAWAPEISADGSSYHLGLVGRYLRERGFSRITNDIYASLSQGLELEFLFAYAFGKHSAAALVHFTFLLVLPFQIVYFARRHGRPLAGMAAGLFVYCSPVVGLDGISAYNDVATAAVLFGLFAVCDLWIRTRIAQLYLWMGLLAGFAYGIKYTAFLGVPYALGVLAWHLRGRWVELRRAVLVTGAVSALFVMPWMIKNTIIVGNPMSPFLNRIFPNPYVSVSFEQEYIENMRHYGGVRNWAEIPLEVTVKGQRLTGLLGPLFLLAPAALLALWTPLGRRLLLAALVFALPFANNIGTRFLIPPLPFLSLALALAFDSVPWLLAGLAVAHALLSWPAVIPKYSDRYPWVLQGIPVKAALRLMPEEEFFGRRFPWYFIAKMVEQHVPPGRNVFSIDQIPEAYTSRNVVVLYQGAANHVMGDILWAPVIPDYHATRHRTFRFGAQTLRRVRVIQTASGAPVHWSVSELRLYANGEELPRRVQWRLRAHPNPWDVQLAFDNDPVTRWRSWQRIFDGMWIDVDLGVPQTVDRLVLEMTRDQWPVQLRLEGEGPAGQWSVLAEKPEETDVPSPAGMRRRAIEELKLRGIGYLLINDTNIGAEDLRSRGNLWGITQLAEQNGVRLYRLD